MSPGPSSPFSTIPPDEWIASNELAFAIRDKFPVTPGHSLVIPRRVVATWWEATRDEQRALLDLVEIVRQQLLAERRPAGFNVGFNAGEAAGQTVAHLHVHVIPRYDGDVPDPRGGIRWVIPAKANYLALASSAPSATMLLPGGDDRMLRRLRALFADPRFDRIDLIVSFVMWSGVEALAEAFESARQRGATVRLLTTDYLGVTEKSALSRLLDWSECEPSLLRLRVFESKGKSFHPKGYVFANGANGEAVGIVGSSNLSRSGLAEGIEWNLVVGTVTELSREFEKLWSHPRTIALTQEWLDSYHPQSRGPSDVGDRLEVHEPFEEVVPNDVQKEALAALDSARKEGARAGLVVMATGLGKTYLAAFDSKKFKRVLFVAHRDEILFQSREVFRRVRREASLGLFHSDEKIRSADVVIASVQTLSRRPHEFDAAAFDYVIVDEFHHAAAASYRRVLDHFRPDFLLGLTATPERMDGADLLALCGDRQLFHCDLVDGIERELLCPFHYFGVRDCVDFTPIPWRNGKFDIATLTAAVETRERADQALREWRSRAQRRTLAFCCTVTHADFMARHFQAAGIRAKAVHSGESTAPRSETIEELRDGKLDVLFSVDIFNEGLDVPEIDTVLMLRPTESPVLFLQQLGRGLRRGAEGKVLRVIDFIGNHRSFLLKPRTLLSLGRHATANVAQTLDAMASGEFRLPDGCSVEYELGLVELFEQLVRRGAHDELENWCLEYLAETGTRPSADQAFRAGFNPGSVRQVHGSWFAFLASLEERATAGAPAPVPVLVEAEAQALRECGELLRDLEVERLTKSYKLLTLKALIADGALLTGASVRSIAATAKALILRDPRLMAEVESDGRVAISENDDAAWIRYWRKNPIAAWIGEFRGKEGKHFRLESDRLVPLFRASPACADAFASMVSEIAEWKLAEHLANRRPLATGSMRCKVSHAGGNPIVRFPDRGRDALPSGGCDFRADGATYRGEFQKIALNVATRAGERGNALHALLRGWFGPAAGHSGTTHHVVFESTDAGWVLRPDAEAMPTADAPGRLLQLFSNYAVACGGFDHPQPSTVQTLHRNVIPIAGIPPPEPGEFIVFARGDSMEGGREPIRHGDPLLLRWVRDRTRRELVGAVVLVRHGRGKAAPVALKRLLDDGRGGFALGSDNPASPNATIAATAEDQVIAVLVRRLRQAEINPLAPQLHRQFRREEIAGLHGVEFNPGNWNAGHVSLDESTVLLVTLDKSEMQRGGEYHDRFEGKERLHWSSQTSTTRAGKRGRELLECLDTGRAIHVWVRGKKSDGAFTYAGLAVPVADEGDAPIHITWRLLDPMQVIPSTK